MVVVEVEHGRASDVYGSEEGRDHEGGNNQAAKHTQESSPPEAESHPCRGNQRTNKWIASLSTWTLISESCNNFHAFTFQYDSPDADSKNGGYSEHKKESDGSCGHDKEHHQGEG